MKSTNTELRIKRAIFNYINGYYNNLFTCTWFEDNEAEQYAHDFVDSNIVGYVNELYDNAYIKENKSSYTVYLPKHEFVIAELFTEKAVDTTKAVTLRVLKKVGE